MARRQQVAGGMDIMGVLSNLPVAVTFLLAIVGWWTAFIGQIIFESKYDRAGGSGSAVGVSWFAIFLQLAVILTLFWVLARGTLEIYRFQLTAFISILVVFSVIGVNQGIFGPISSQTAIGAGWLLLAIVNVLWLLFITADDETRLALVFSSYAGEVTPHRTRSIMRQSRRTSSALGISNNQSSVTDFHSSHNHHAPGSAGSVNGGMSSGGGGGSGAYGSGGPGYGGKMQSSNGYAPPTIVMSPAVGGGNSGSMGGRAATPQQLYGAGGGGGAQMSQSAPHNLGGPTGSATASSLASQAPMAASAPTQDMPASTSNTNVSGGGGAAKDASAAAAPAAGAAGAAGPTTAPFKMKASFSYTASPDDPNEISFVKGEILEILDNSGKWFNARKHDGQEGIVPSNYLEALP